MNRSLPRFLVAVTAASVISCTLTACDSEREIPVKTGQSDQAQSGDPAPALADRLPKPTIWPVEPLQARSVDAAGLKNAKQFQDPVGSVSTDWWGSDGLPMWSQKARESIGVMADDPAVTHIAGTIEQTTGNFLSERLVAEGDDASKVLASRTVWANAEDGAGMVSHDLITPEAVQVITTTVADSLAWAAGDFDYFLRNEPERTEVDRAADITFSADGTMKVVFPESATGTLQVVTVPDDQVDGLLSDTGRQVRDGVKEGAAFIGIPEEPPSAPPVLNGLLGAAPTEGIDCSMAQCVALTFDDGPNPNTTPKILDELKKVNAHGTFFVLGGPAAGNPDILKRAVDEGNVIASHSWNHPNLKTADDATVLKELNDTGNAIKDATGGWPVMMRPPYGEYDMRVRNLTSSVGQALIRWDVDTQDWSNKDTKKTTDNALKDAKDGSIILMHDIHPSNIAAIAPIVNGLRAKGLEPVTIPTLLGGRPQPGSVYFSKSVVY